MVKKEIYISGFPHLNEAFPHPPLPVVRVEGELGDRVAEGARHLVKRVERALLATRQEKQSTKRKTKNMILKN